MVYDDSKSKYQYNQKSATKFIFNMNTFIDYRKLESNRFENKVL